MTNAYDTLKLRHLPQVTQASGATTDVLDQLYEFEALANDDANGDGKIDFFEAKVTADAAWDQKNLGVLQRGVTDPSGATPYFSCSRYFVDDAGAVWEGGFGLEDKGSGHIQERWLGYERFDGTPFDDNPTDGNFYIAPEDIGRAFKNKEGHKEFTNFIDAIAKQYGSLFDAILTALKGKELPAASISAETISTLLADPNTSVKGILEQIYAPAAIHEHLANIEKLDLFHRYLAQGQALNATDASKYELPTGAVAKDLRTLVPTGVTVAGKPSAPTTLPPIAMPPAPALKPGDDNPWGAIAPLLPDATPVPLAPVQSQNIYGATKPASADLTILNTAVADITRLLPGALPTGLKFDHALIDTGGAKKTWPDMIIDEKGKFKFAFLGDSTYPYTADGIHNLRTDLWEYAKKKKPEPFYFGATDLDAATVSMKEDSGIVRFEGDDFAPADKAELDRVATLLKSASATELAGVTVTGYASASGEKIKGPDGKTYVIVENDYKKSMTGKVKIADCIGENDQPKADYSWIDGQKPPTGTNNTSAAKGKIDKVVAYLRAQGVSDAILKSESLFKTVRAGGMVQAGARVEFTWKESADFKLRTGDFTGIAADKQGALAIFLTGPLNEGFFKTAQGIVRSADSESAKKNKLLAAATNVKIALRRSFDAATAEVLAGQIFDKIAGNRAIAGSGVLSAVLNAAFFRGQRAIPAKTASAALEPTVEASAAKMADTYSFYGATTFTINGGTPPTIQISHGGSQNIASINRPYGKREAIAFHIVACNPESCTIVLDGMNAYAQAYRKRKLADPDNALAAEGVRAKYGVMAYDLDVTFKDGSVKRIQVRATGV
jgi:hypothetical protein